MDHLDSIGLAETQQYMGLGNDISMIKTPPSSMEAEVALLGCFLNNADTLSDIDYITPEHFYHAQNRELFKVIKYLEEKKITPDIITVADRMTELDLLDQHGGLKGLIALADNVPSARNAPTYADAVIAKHTNRMILEASRNIDDIVYDNDIGNDEKLDLAQAEIMGIQNQSTVNLPSLTSILKKSVDLIDERYNTGTGMMGISCGFKALDDRLKGLVKKDYYVIAGRPSMGKELRNSAGVLLEDGTFKAIGDIGPGERVASVDGRESVVTGHFPQGVKPVYKITFADGRSVEAGLDHQWEVMFRQWEEPRVLTTSELINKLKAKRYKNRLSVPLVSGDFGLDKNLHIHPYLLGVLIGDGGLSAGSVSLTNSDSHITNKITSMLDGCNLRSDDKNNHAIRTDRGQKNNIIDSLKVMGLYGKKSIEKFIPKQYLSASKESRLELIRGLIDTDGTVEKWGTMTYSTSSELLAYDFLDLTRSLGAYATLSSRIPTYTYRGEKKKGQRSYKITINSEDHGEFLTLPRKKERVSATPKTRNLSIQSIEYIGDFDCSCISVSHERSLYVTDDYIATHNTALAMNIVENVIMDGGCVIVFSIEMGDVALADRMLASIGGIPFERIRTGALEEEDWPKLTHAVSLLKDKPLFIDERSELTPMMARGAARKIAQDHDISLIVFDYLQLMHVPGQENNREREISKISASMKSLAKEMDCPVIALSQLSRKCEERPNKRPRNSDLRDSGSVEQDADGILFVYRDSYYNKDNTDKNTTEIIAGKLRNGIVDTDYLVADLAHMRFNNMVGQYKPPADDEPQRGKFRL